ncbi:MAG: hypothetical protein OHK93_005424 [Ramalina farinacea]|uniref:Methionine synthase n=1 Tax=Ramalina farinacea TaxID=258253 RepID=A0AA43TS24_9LECA|nr:hypothetical protein [Ramalina farinacea]
MSAAPKPSKALLVGSSPLDSSSEFFSTVLQTLTGRLDQLPDGETGPRKLFVAWQKSVFPIEILQPRFGGPPSGESIMKKYTLEDIRPTGYDDDAIASYAIFRELKRAEKVPKHVRFQVSLPSPLGVVRFFVEDGAICAQVEPLYEERLIQAVKRIQEHIPPWELTIQWDVPAEIAILEYERGGLQDKYWKPWFENPESAILDRLGRLAKAVAPDVEMGYHLCYGNKGNVHFLEPPDMDLMVHLTNQLVQAISESHDIAYIHMPVPKDRRDAAYFQPMAGLDLHDTELYLGLVHAHDEDGTRQRLEAAQRVYPDITGVATECGLGRSSREDFQSILEICASVTA